VTFVWLLPHGAPPGYPGDEVILHGVAVAFTACGFLAWSRRPRHFIGPMMMLFALVWWSNFLEGTDTTPLLFTLGSAVDGGGPFLLAYMLFAFPQGRIRGFGPRAILWVTGTIFIGLQPLIVVYDPRQWGCTHCGPHTNLLLIDGRADILRVRDDIVVWVYVAVCFAFAVTMAARYLRASFVERRVIGPLYVPAMVWALAWMAALLGPKVSSGYFLSSGGLGHTLFRIWNIALLIVPVTFLYGMHRTRGRRARVADLIRELGAGPSLARLETALARALGDPSLQLGARAGEGYLRPDLSRFELPDRDDGRRAVTELPGSGGALGVLAHDPALLLDDRELLDAVAAAARLAIDNERLQEEVRQQLEALRESRRRILAAGDEARQRIERNLHDGAQQRLVSLLVALRLAEMQVGSDGDPGLQATLRDMGEQLDAAIDELRDIARGLHPTVLTDKGLAAAVLALAERATVPVVVDRLPRERLPAMVEAAAYYVVAEALTNAARYARAELVRIAIERVEGWLTVEVGDDGRGGAAIEKGSGLRGLIDRVEAVGGSLEVQSRVGAGTTVRARIPCGEASPAATAPRPASVSV
jgi:signal transduction histidine kinase